MNKAYLFENEAGTGRALSPRSDAAILPAGQVWKFLREFDVNFDTLVAAGVMDTKEAMQNLAHGSLYPFLPSDRAK